MIKNLLYITRTSLVGMEVRYFKQHVIGGNEWMKFQRVFIGENEGHSTCTPLVEMEEGHFLKKSFSYTNYARHYIEGLAITRYLFIFYLFMYSLFYDNDKAHI